MPSREAEYRNLVLNQRVEMNSPFVSPAVWKSCGGPVRDSFKGLPVFGALDLSEVSDLTSLTLAAQVENVWHIKPTFWLPLDGLPERARKDRVPYDLWHREGHLLAAPGKSIEYQYIAEHLRGVFDRYDVRKIAFDRWNFKHLKPWLEKAGFSEEELARFEEFGQGFQSMSPALRDLESALLNARIAHGGHPVLQMCAANAVVVRDPAGNRKLNKARSRGRIDGMVTLAMVMSTALRHTVEAVSVYETPGFFV